MNAQDPFSGKNSRNKQSLFFSEYFRDHLPAFRPSFDPNLDNPQEINADIFALNFLMSLWQSLPLPVVAIALEDGLILFCNDHFSRLLQVEENLLIGQSFLRYCPVGKWQQCCSLLKVQQFIDSYQLRLKNAQNEFCQTTFSGNLLEIGRKKIMVGVCQQSPSLQNMDLSEAEATKTLVGKTVALTQALQKSQNHLAEAIKARHNIQASLESSEERFYFLAESIPQQVWIADEKGDCTYVNQEVLEYLGCTPSEILGAGWQNYTHPDDIEPIQQACQIAVNQASLYESTCRLRRTDGEYGWFVSRALPFKDNTGKIVNWFGTNTDISAYNQTEKALRESEECLQVALDAAQMGTWEWHRRTGSLVWTNRLEQLYGMEPGTFDGSYETFLQKIHERDRDSVLQAFEQAIKQGHPYEIEFRVVWEDGSIHWLASKGLVFSDETGTPYRMAGVDMDITVRREAEASLRQAEAKYRSIFENAVEGIFQTSLDGRFLSANPALATLYGYESPEALIADITDIAQQLYVDPVHRQILAQQLAESTGIITFETRVYRRDRSIIWIVEKVRAIRDSDGNILHYEGTVEDITERKHTKEQLHRQAYYDTLTELPNRALFMERLRGTLADPQQTSPLTVDPASPRYFALLFLDLDRFKYINDSLGHLIGDQLLVAVARRLEKCVRPDDLVARLGGDEFTVLLDPIDDPQQVIQIAERIQTRLGEPFKIDGHRVFTGASIGVLLCNGEIHASSLLDPDQSETDEDTTPYQTAEELLRDADTALYRAKALGKGRYEVFDQTMRKAMVKRLQLENDLRNALDWEEFEVHYQPIVSLTNGDLLGFEALLRWWHPTQGYINPSQFITIAEETGLIVPLGAWMIRQSCQQLQQWQDRLSLESQLVVHVNLSSKQLVWTELVEQIDLILAETGVSGKQLKLEITESNWFQNIQSRDSCLPQLHAREINLCIDNFGIGHSSLYSLQHYPVEALKIDKSYVRHLTQRDSHLEITRTIINLAHSLGMSAIAEGIESVEQLQILQELGCDKGQGYFFASALDAQTAEILLDIPDSPFID